MNIQWFLQYLLHTDFLDSLSKKKSTLNISVNCDFSLNPRKKMPTNIISETTIIRDNFQR